MRMTVHNGRAGKNGVYSPKHNDRQFDISSAEHIDPERMPGNLREVERLGRKHCIGLTCS